jgi:GH43 family beta-xylosidase
MKYCCFLTGLLCCFFGCGSKTNSPSPPPGNGTADSSFSNPLLPNGADPWVLQHDSVYYYTHTTGDRILIYATKKMSELGKATPTTVWMPPPTGDYSKEIWAPEIHFLQNRWYIYFAADDGNNDHHRIYALECDDPDPVKGTWTFRGKIADTATDKWAIDASVFEYGQQLYMIWSGWKGDVNGEQDIFIAKMKDPLTLNGPRVLIASPTHDWERAGAPPSVNEGPEALTGPGGRLFLTFSAGGCWTDQYCLGLLSLKDGGDPLQPGDWTKSDNPVFSSYPEGGVFGPGHNGFFRSRDGREDWILYHANSAAGQGCGANRNPRMQPFTWKSDGSPDFGTPASIYSPLRKPGGE